MTKFNWILVLILTILIGCKQTDKKEMPTEGTDEPAVVGADNSQNSLDWAGVYEGTIPCADCEGIFTVLELSYDNTYVLTQTYLGSPEIENQFKERGNFSWNQAGSLIRLNTESGRFAFKVGENQLWMLDQKGAVIEGEMADLYILKKINE